MGAAIPHGIVTMALVERIQPLTVRSAEGHARGQVRPGYLAMQ